MPSKKRKFSSRFPPARIKKIMQTDEDVGKVAVAVPVIISRALEMFIESLILKSAEATKSRNAKTLSSSHIKQIIVAEKKFDFLKDLVSSVPDAPLGEDGGETSAASVVERKPPKHSIAKQSSTTPKVPAPVTPGKRPRGRPRKVRPEDIVAPKPVKRPKTDETSDEEDDDTETDSAGEESHSDHDDSGSGGMKLQIQPTADPSHIPTSPSQPSTSQEPTHTVSQAPKSGDSLQMSQEQISSNNSRVYNVGADSQSQHGYAHMHQSAQQHTDGQQQLIPKSPDDPYPGQRSDGRRYVSATSEAYCYPGTSHTIHYGGGASSQAHVGGEGSHHSTDKQQCFADPGFKTAEETEHSLSREHKMAEQKSPVKQTPQEEVKHCVAMDIKGPIKYEAPFENKHVADCKPQGEMDTKFLIAQKGSFKPEHPMGSQSEGAPVGGYTAESATSRTFEVKPDFKQELSHTSPSHTSPVDPKSNVDCDAKIKREEGKVYTGDNINRDLHDSVKAKLSYKIKHSSPDSIDQSHASVHNPMHDVKQGNARNPGSVPHALVMAQAERLRYGEQFSTQPLTSPYKPGQDSSLAEQRSHLAASQLHVPGASPRSHITSPNARMPLPPSLAARSPISTHQPFSAPRISPQSTHLSPTSSNLASNLSAANFTSKTRLPAPPALIPTSCVERSPDPIDQRRKESASVAESKQTTNYYTSPPPLVVQTNSNLPGEKTRDHAASSKNTNQEMTNDTALDLTATKRPSADVMHSPMGKTHSNVYEKLRPFSNSEGARTYPPNFSGEKLHMAHSPANNPRMPQPHSALDDTRKYLTHPGAAQSYLSAEQSRPNAEKHAVGAQIHPSAEKRAVGAQIHLSAEKRAVGAQIHPSTEKRAVGAQIHLTAEKRAVGAHNVTQEKTENLNYSSKSAPSGDKNDKRDSKSDSSDLLPPGFRGLPPGVSAAQMAAFAQQMQAMATYNPHMLAAAAAGFPPTGIPPYPGMTLPPGFPVMPPHMSAMMPGGYHAGAAGYWPYTTLPQYSQQSNGAMSRPPSQHSPAHPPKKS